MSQDTRRAVRLALLAALGFALPAAAVEMAVPHVGADAPVSAVPQPFVSLSPVSPLPLSFLALSPVSSLPLAAPSVQIAAQPLPFVALSPVSAAAPSVQVSAVPQPFVALSPAAPLSFSFLALSPTAPSAAAAPRSAAPALDALSEAAASVGDAGYRFDGNRAKAPVSFNRNANANAQAPAADTLKGFIKNADGVWVGGRVAEQALWINRMYAQLSPKIDLADVVDVMDDAYDEARVKLGSVERAAHERKIAQTSVHLEGTRNWIDAILVDAEGRSVAVHTHRVYFHPAPGNPASEISEGIRRADKYLEKVKKDFASGGQAEQEYGKPFAQVELNFDTRGYKEIADHIRQKEAEFHAAYGARFAFKYITQPKMASAPLRAEYNRLVELYMDQKDALMGVLDGVTYSREVGVGHELNSHKKRLAMGLKVVQAGRDFFGKKVMPDGTIVEEYKTEFDAVTEPVADAAKPLKERDVVLWEDKSTRVWLPLEDTMEQTFLYKLRIYKENRAIIEASLGAPLKVAFSVDVGGLNRRAAKQGVLVWKDPRQKELLEHLQKSGPELSKEYGFPVSFIFVNSHPNEDSDLFYKEAVTEEAWQASQRGGSRNGRKHGRNSGR